MLTGPTHPVPTEMGATVNRSRNRIEPITPVRAGALNETTNVVPGPPAAGATTTGTDRSPARPD
jgi:hypothetical protein